VRSTFGLAALGDELSLRGNAADLFSTRTTGLALTMRPVEPVGMFNTSKRCGEEE
jgi:hypothetical protein